MIFRATLIFLLSVLFVCNLAWSQCAGSLYFITQAEIDSFPILHPGCDSVGSIYIQGDDIQNIDALSSIEYVEWDVRIFNNPILSDLSGFANLQAVRSLEIVYNPSLTSLTGLSSLVEVKNRFQIINNSGLKSIASLEKLRSTEILEIVDNDSLIIIENVRSLSTISELFIEENPRLLSILDFDSLKIVEVKIHLSRNYSLENIEGFHQLEEVQDFFISYNDSLKTLNGLGNLLTVQHLSVQFHENLEQLTNFVKLKTINTLWITECPKLSTFIGLDSLRSVLWYFNIRDNDLLIDPTGLENLSMIGNLNLSENDRLISLDFLHSVDVLERGSIDRNDQLTDCALLALCNHPAPEDLYIYNNGVGCNSLEEIEHGCSLQHNTVTGTVYLDLNCNLIFDSNDVKLKNHLVLDQESQLPVSATDTDGNFTAFLNPNDTMVILPKAINHYDVDPDAYQLITDFTIQAINDANFAFCPGAVFHDLTGTLAGFDAPSPGFNNSYQVCIQNFGNAIVDGMLLLDFSNSPAADYISILDAQGGVINGLTISWAVSDIPLFDPVCFNVEINISSSAPLTTHLLAFVQVIPAMDIIEMDTTNNHVILKQVILGSYDPNDKIVNHDTIGFDDHEVPLTYTIRFQNTGSLPASFIEIIDSIPIGLNMRSFAMIAASHDYSLSFPDTNIIKWRFDNIQLPDSSSNEPESHGFVHFAINARGNLAANSVIRNAAAIYFDFNSAVITNQAQTLVDLQIGTKYIVDDKYQLSIYPNPTSGLFQLRLNLKSKTASRIEMFDPRGNIVTSEDLTYLSEGIHIIPMDVSSFSNGIYFLRFLTDNGLITRKVMIAR